MVWVCIVLTWPPLGFPVGAFVPVEAGTLQLRESPADSVDRTIHGTIHCERATGRANERRTRCRLTLFGSSSYPPLLPPCVLARNRTVVLPRLAAGLPAWLIGVANRY